jgi:hypothetical protein
MMLGYVTGSGEFDDGVWVEVLCGTDAARDARWRLVVGATATARCIGVKDVIGFVLGPGGYAVWSAWSVLEANEGVDVAPVALELLRVECLRMPVAR